VTEEDGFGSPKSI
jgi:hypothetical protein